VAGSDDGAQFLAGIDRWRSGLGRLRDVVRQELVAAELVDVLDELGVHDAQILDAGCGQGTQALRLAQAGHRVTGLDLSDDLLDAFAHALDDEPQDVRERVRFVRGSAQEVADRAPGRYDVLLCHGVLMYLTDVAPLLTALTEVAAPTAVLSLLVRNGIAPAMRDGLRGEWPGALAAFDSRDYVNRLGVPAHAHAPSDLDAVLGPLGWRRHVWYGVRVFTDHRDEPAPPAEQLVALLAAERQAASRDPYRSVAALLHLVYRRDVTLAGSQQ
jgi:SAM-dependent methyltransferase